MILLLAVLERVLARFPSRPGSNGKEVKITKIPTIFAGRHHSYGLPNGTTNRAHLMLGIPIFDRHTLNRREEEGGKVVHMQ